MKHLHGQVEFKRFWSQLPESHRGAWTESDTRTRRSRHFKAADIVRVRQMLKAEECNMLVNLYHHCEQGQIAQAGKPINESRHFRLPEMARAIILDPGFAGIASTIENVRHDLVHDHSRGSKTKPVLTALIRRYEKAYPAKQRTENPAIYATAWMLWLNDDYEGGEVFFPSRQIVVKPKRGDALRWPVGIPVGIALARKGYAFTLEGMSSEDKEEEWKVLFGPQLTLPPAAIVN